VPQPPQMFRDHPEEKKLSKAKRISDLKNLGPVMESAFLAAGIKTPKQMIKMGWKSVMKKLCLHNPKNHHSILAYAVIGALKDEVWNRISDEDKRHAREFMKSLRENSLK